MKLLDDDERYNFNERLGILAGDKQPTPEQIALAEKQILERRKQQTKVKTP